MIPHVVQEIRPRGKKKSTCSRLEKNPSEIRSHGIDPLTSSADSVAGDMKNPRISALHMDNSARNVGKRTTLPPNASRKKVAPGRRRRHTTFTSGKKVMKNTGKKVMKNTAS